jgi:cyclopropane-fatty-acyl-phospholipid synthase
MNRNSLKKSRENISFHYDLNNDFFQSFLDSTMTYSSALYTDKNMSLEEAQNAKYQNLCDNLELKESDEVLEIGCGWGGFSRYAASKYGCKFTCLTISKEQFDFAVAKNKEVGLDHLIEVKMQDYRLETKQFDKIASIEMMEAIGHEYLPTFYKKVSGLLKPEGIFSYQVITCPDSRYTQFRKGIDWIQKHIFPGSLLLAVGHMTKVFNEVSDMQLHKFIDFGPDYARTLNEWHKRFNDELPKIRTLGFDEPFIRKWNYYLKYCEAAFEMRNISVVQMTLVRPNNKTLK